MRESRIQLGNVRAFFNKLLQSLLHQVHGERVEQEGEERAAEYEAAAELLNYVNEGRSYSLTVLYWL